MDRKEVYHALCRALYGYDTGNGWAFRSPAHELEWEQQRPSVWFMACEIARECSFKDARWLLDRFYADKFDRQGYQYFLGWLSAQDFIPEVPGLSTEFLRKLMASDTPRQLEIDFEPPQLPKFKPFPTPFASPGKYVVTKSRY